MVNFKLCYETNATFCIFAICASLRKKPTFRNTTTGFPSKWWVRNEGRNSLLMTHHYPYLGGASDKSCCIGNLLQPIRSTTQIWVVWHCQYGTFTLFSQTSFLGETSGGIAKGHLFYQAKYLLVYKCNARERSELVHMHSVAFYICILNCWCVPAFNVSCVGKQINLRS